MRSRTFRALDRDGRTLGRLADVWRCDGSGLSWGVLRGGWRRRCLVPLRDARYEPGRVRLAIDAEAVRTAPPIPARRDLSAREEAQLRAHYGI
jgi:hypothetical protein